MLREGGRTLGRIREHFQKPDGGPLRDGLQGVAEFGKAAKLCGRVAGGLGEDQKSVPEAC
jgi:hypothetical protein